MVHVTADRGAQVGRRLAELFADTHAKVRAAAAPAEAAIKAQAVTAHMEAMESELAPMARAMFAGMVDSDDIPEEAKTILREVTHPQHQVSFILQLLTFPAIVGGIAGAYWAPKIEAIRAKAWTENQNLRLPAEVAAQAAVRGVLSPREAIGEAAQSGVNDVRMGWLIALAGEPPGPMQLLEAWRRGVIDETEARRGLLYSRLAPDWVETFLGLRYQPPGASTAIEAAVQNHLPMDQAKVKATEAGLDPVNFDWLYALAGNPPGNEHMIDLMHRGVLSRAEVEQGMRESRLKNKYIKPMIDGGYHLPPMRTVIALGHKGLLTKEQVLSKLLALGFHHDDAAVMASEATADKLASAKDLARSQVVAGYEERLFTRAQATAHLVGLGYDTEEAAFVLDLADHDRERKFTNAAIGRFHTLYVRRRVDKTTVSSALDRLGVPAGQRDDLLTLWDLERTADTPDLTTAQWQGLFRRNVITEERFTAEMLKKGWSDEEAGFLKYLAFPPSQSTVGP